MFEEGFWLPRQLKQPYIAWCVGSLYETTSGQYILYIDANYLYIELCHVVPHGVGIDGLTSIQIACAARWKSQTLRSSRQG